VPVKFVNPASKATPKRAPLKPSAPVIALDQPGRLRVSHVMALLGIGRATLYERIAAKRLPAPDGHDGRPYWNTSSIRAVLMAGEPS
jgi:predicted DNA-binding transcriptional regulator AlpA